MTDYVFKKHVELIASMSIDYMVKGELTKQTYLDNLKTIIKIMEKKDNRCV